MILKLESEGPRGLSHLIDQGSDLTRLNVDVPSGTPYTEIAGYLREVNLGAGITADDSTVLLYIKSLAREFGELTGSPDTAAFDNMINHARTRGWLDPAGATIRVRIVYY